MTRSWLHRVRTKSYFTAQCKMLPTHRERLTKAPNQTADNFFFYKTLLMKWASEAYQLFLLNAHLKN